MPELHLIGMRHGKKAAEIIEAPTEEVAVAQAKAMGLQVELVRLCSPPEGLQDAGKPLPVGEHTRRGHMRVQNVEDQKKRMELAARYGVDLPSEDPPAGSTTEERTVRALETLAASPIVQRPISTIMWGVIFGTILMILVEFFIAVITTGGHS